VNIIGSGVVGFATGVALAGLGHRVAFTDVNPTRVDEIRQKGYVAGEDVSEESSIFLVSVPTPATSQGYDFSFIERAARMVARSLRDRTDEAIVVVRSTVTPGFIDRFLHRWIEEESGRSVGDGISLVSAPEFLREDSALDDAGHPWMTVVGGYDANAVARVASMFAPLGGEIRTFDEPMSAEFVKIVHNCFNAAKISFWNEMHHLCAAAGVNQLAIAEVVALSAEASFNPQYGIRGGRAFGGNCLPKDLDGLLGFAHGMGKAVPLLSAVRTVNLGLMEGLDEAPH
jgi:UDPglucose 6-dehydrogenase